MFGYVRPLAGELKVKEYERFRAAYCGLCGALSRQCGFFARFTLNYDFTFLAMLLSSQDELCAREHKRCIASPFRKQCRCVTTDKFALCADMSMILAWWKLKDSLQDEGFAGRLKASLAMLFLRRAYRRAAARAPEFNRTVEARLGELSQLEASGCDSLDAAADKFAAILTAAADGRDRAMSELLYHLGRQIYILDAIDDLKEDAGRRRYNPVARRFGIADGALDPDSAEYLRITLNHSSALMSSAFVLLPQGVWTPVLENIIYLGIPWVAGCVLDGTWRKPRDRMPK